MKVFITIIRDDDGFPMLSEVANNVEEIKRKEMIYTAELPIGYEDLLKLYSNIKKGKYDRIKPYSGEITLDKGSWEKKTYKFEKGELIQ